MNWRSPKLLERVRELPCQLCGAEDGTVCAAHSNSLSDGKGKGIKAHDWAVAALCLRCHSQIDQGKDASKADRRAMWLEAERKTHAQLFERGLVRVV